MATSKYQTALEREQKKLNIMIEQAFEGDIRELHHIEILEQSQRVDRIIVKIHEEQSTKEFET